MVFPFDQYQAWEQSWSAPPTWVSWTTAIFPFIGRLTQNTPKRMWNSMTRGDCEWIFGCNIEGCTCEHVVILHMGSVTNNRGHSSTSNASCRSCLDWHPRILAPVGMCENTDWLSGLVLSSLVIPKGGRWLSPLCPSLKSAVSSWMSLSAAVLSVRLIKRSDCCISRKVLSAR